MGGLKKYEINMLKTINKSGFKGKNSIKTFLHNKLGLNDKSSNYFYSLWFLNYREDGKYEEITDADKNLTPFLDILKRVQSGDLDPADIPDKFYGEKLKECVESYSGNWNLPCVELDSNTVWFKLDQETWEQPAIGGIWEEDLWKFYEAKSSYTDHYEEYETEEFDYFHFNDETISLIKQIAVSAKRKEVIDYIDNNQNNLQSEMLADYLKEMLPEDKYDNMVNDYLSEIGYMTTTIRNQAVSDYYDDEIKYPVTIYHNTYEMDMPLEDLIEIVENENIFSFSDIITDDITLQEGLDLDSVYYDSGYWESEDKSHIEELNRHLQNILDDLGEGGLEEYYKNKKYFDDIIKNSGLEIKRRSWGGGKVYASKDGRLELDTTHLDLYTKKVTFTYDGEKHTVPLENFIGWAQGSVLNLKNESINKLLKENKNTITKISIFDFDGTLADTPKSEEGIKKWEEVMGVDYPHIGWYSKRESLDPDVFDIKLIQSTVNDYLKEIKNNNTLVVMLTGRMPNQSDQIEKILNDSNITFDDYLYKEKGDTFSSKINTIKRLLSQNPNVTEIEMWEDRLNHADGFERWGDENGIDIKVNRIIQ